ncbi:malate synthase G [Altererythrobacter salegens]|uniref:Malate synthase G n=1 Tax=Croceibacterium salegens TaxID=1737568 RepID=A0A6I4SZA3_9SPHN|nr:malate synthase G [Croceibacterium salegens]MXO61331.1 malate synthase G [Croceibacterium salegens]
MPTSELGVTIKEPNTCSSASGSPFVERAALQIAAQLAAFVEDEVLPGTDIDAGLLWAGLADLLARFGPRNSELLTRREQFQRQIDDWYGANGYGATSVPEGFLRDIGYLVDEPEPFTIGTANVDEEIATIAGPQLVVPVLNARFMLNAANARWGSLYDALYGTDALGEHSRPGPYDPRRGEQVIAWGRAFLDQAVPLAGTSWTSLCDPMTIELSDPTQFVGTTRSGLLFRNNSLHIEVVFDREHPIGRTDAAGIADLRLESALTTIVDCEDSVAAVDAADKTAAYRNWLGLMRGDLAECFDKGGLRIERVLAADKTYQAPDGATASLPGRSLLLVRNVGHLMTSPAVLLPDGNEAYEGLLDAVFTTLVALHDLKGLGRFRNSRAGSVYVVKPKMHGPEEAAFANDVFSAVEDLLGLERYTVKIGVMDEERRTSANLPACIAAVKDRVFFINTGFLDRTGDEIHTSMRAGPVMRKNDIKAARWIHTYEDRNVQIGLACGFAGRAQIGKGMWAAPDNMADMLEQKIVHPMSGASTAWVPSPTAATLHATHYHRCDVAAQQAARSAEAVADLSGLLEVPLAANSRWTEQEIAEELDNNIQGILGYVVRWIDQGVGCSKVPDIHDVGLMEDRATLRISSQHIANWLLHGIIDREQVEETIERMARLIDDQNAGDPTYRPMIDRQGNCLPIEATRSLIYEGTSQPSGYTEPLLHQFRRKAKALCSRNPTM